METQEERDVKEINDGLVKISKEEASLEPEWTPELECAELIRISMDEEDVQNQYFVLNKHIERYKLHLALSPFEEILSGKRVTKTIIQRPVLKDILGAAKEGRFKVLLVREASRITREGGYEMVYYLRRLAAWGVKVWSADKGWILVGTRMQELNTYIIGMFAAVEADSISRRTADSSARQQSDIDKQGYYITKEGNKLLKVGRPKKDVPEDIKNRALQYRTLGYQLDAILKKINMDFKLTKEAGTELTLYQLRQILMPPKPSKEAKKAQEEKAGKLGEGI